VDGPWLFCEEGSFPSLPLCTVTALTLSTHGAKNQGRRPVGKQGPANKHLRGMGQSDWTVGGSAGDVDLCVASRGICVLRSSVNQDYVRGRARLPMYFGASGIWQLYWVWFQLFGA